LSYSVDSFCADFVDSLNPSVQMASPRVDGVSLQSGEFNHKATDLIVEGRGLDLVVTRNYQSQTHYRGAFGRGWDSPLFRRLCDFPSALVPAETRLPLTIYGVANKDRVAVPGDVLIQTGAGDLKVYRQISSANGNLDHLPLFTADPAIQEFGWAGKIAVFYESPPDEFDMLVRFTDGSYVSIDPQATRFYYDAEGRVTRVASAYDQAQWTFEYRPDGKLDRVVGDRGIALEFGYYGRTTSPDFKSSVDKPFPDETRLGLIARIKAGAQDIQYTYDVNASLKTVQGSSPTMEVYGYQQEAPYLLSAIGLADGAQGPSEQIFYQDGLVTQTIVNGVKRTYTGALALAQDRQTAGSAQVSVITGTATARFGVDSSGLGTSYGGSAVKAGTNGLIQSFGTGNDALVNLYDTNNSVFRFRGNLMGVQAQNGLVSGSFTYDHSAWNRLSSRTSAEGVVTTFGYANSAGHNPATTLTVTTGPVTGQTALNDWGQVSMEQATENGVTFQKTTLFTDGLPSGLREGSIDALTLTRGSGAQIASVARGAVVQTPTIDPQGQITGISTGNGGPSITMGYSAGAGNLSSVSVSGGSGTVSEIITPTAADPGRADTFTFNQTGVPNESGAFSYNAAGQITGYTTAKEAVSVTYDGVRPKTYDAPGEHYGATYGPGGRVATITQNGLDATLTYDGQGRPKSLIHGGTTRALTYNLGQQIASETITDGTGTLSSLQFSYDAAGRLRQVAGSALTKVFEYFPDGTARAIKLGNFEVSRFTRDQGGYLSGAAFFRRRHQCFSAGFGAGLWTPPACKPRPPSAAGQSRKT